MYTNFTALLSFSICIVMGTAAAPSGNLLCLQ